MNSRVALNNIVAYDIAHQADLNNEYAAISKDLDMLDLLKKHLMITSLGGIQFKQITRDNFAEDRKDLIKIREWLEKE